MDCMITMDLWTPKSVMAAAALCRLLLICYGRIQDYIMQVKFTDIDYGVYSDAAQLLYQGSSPFERDTYRYSPLLAYFLLPTVKYPDFGKLLFNVCDLVVGWLLYDLARVGRVNNFDSLSIMIIWLFNPLTAIISSRGNADAMVCATVLATLRLIYEPNWFLAALTHGTLAIQLKIYPIIYLPSIFLHFTAVPFSFTWRYIVKLITNWKGYAYCLVCLGSFGISVWLCYFLFGQKYLNEAIWYHFSRTDTRHNFSPYFYLLYLSKDDEQWTKLIGLGAFIPQAILIVIFAFRYYRDLPFCWFLTTVTFVSLNKVCTSQYFVWYLSLLPLLYPKLRHHLTLRSTVKLISLWFGSQGIWLFFAYLLEFKGYNTYIWIWISSLLFALVNFWIVRVIINNYTDIIHSKTE